MKLDDFNYYLPKNLIAKRPRKSFKKSKLLVCKEKIIVDFYDLVKRLNSNDVLVFNNTKVLPVVIFGYYKLNKIKITLLNCIDKKIWTAFIKPSKKIHVGETIIFNKDIRCELKSKKSIVAPKRNSHLPMVSLK